MGLLEATADAMNGNFPELGSHGLLNLGILNPFNGRLQISPDRELTLDATIVLHPDAEALVSLKTRLPGVTIFIGGTEGIANVTAGGDGSLKGCGHTAGLMVEPDPRQTPE